MYVKGLFLETEHVPFAVGEGSEMVKRMRLGRGDEGRAVRGIKATKP